MAMISCYKDMLMEYVEKVIAEDSRKLMVYHRFAFSIERMGISTFFKRKEEQVLCV